MPHLFRLPLVLLVLLLLAIGPGAAAAPTEAPATTERWYEILRDGQKLGYSCVVWAPSTWESKATLHDTTTTTQRSVRTMMGIRDVFETVSTIDLERGVDGTLWWMKVEVDEAGRKSSTETTWTGKGYRHVTTIDGEAKEISIPLDEPVMTDVEAFLGQRIRAGEVKVGDRFELRQLDVAARAAHVSEVEILARESVVDGAVEGDGEAAEPVEIGCYKVRERDPKSGASTLLWIDDDGAFVRLVAEGGVSYRRVARAQAEARPVRPAEYSVTTPSRPWLERIMSADRLTLDLHLRGDPDRPLPEFPTSPWSRVVDVSGSDEEGWVVQLRIDAFDVPGRTTTLPIPEEEREAAGLARHLESTALMPIDHEELQAVVAEVVGEEKDARTAAEALARWVFTELDKQSPDVAQASALQILRERRGDCSEHALLYVALCRAAGIPTRQCSGYVCIGPQWGAHAWAEVWLGEWVGADPTTGEVGPGARYVLFGYYDDPESYPGIVSARARGRMRFVVTRLEEGETSVDLEDESAWRVHDRENGRYVHALAGIEMRDVPRDWVVRMLGNNRAVVRGPGLTITVRADADQGFTLENFGGANDTFCGVPARKVPLGSRGVAYMLHSRRRLLQVLVQTEDVDAVLETLGTVLAPTFADPPPGPAPEEGAAEEPREEPAEEAVGAGR